MNGPTPSYFLWKISKETIDMGLDRKDRFPMYRYTYKLNPEGQTDAVDLNLEARDLFILDKTQAEKSTISTESDWAFIL